MGKKLLLPGSDGWERVNNRLVSDYTATSRDLRHGLHDALATIEHLTKRLRAQGPCGAVPNKSVDTPYNCGRGYGHGGEHGVDDLLDESGSPTSINWTDADNDPTATEANEKRIMKELLGDDDG